MEILDKIQEITGEKFEDGEWEIGDEEVVVFNDAIMICSLTEEGYGVKIIAGEYDRRDTNLNL